MTKYASREALRAANRERHAREFELHGEVAAAILPVLLTSRSSPDVVSTSLDFLFIQAYKAHDAVALLAAEGLIEDAATITRRLLEIAIQAVYIGADSEAEECERRAGRFLAFLWREANEAAKEHLSDEAQIYWREIEKKHGSDISPDARRWGPSFRKMFAYAEQIETYDEDYSILSRIAHGGPEEFLLHHSAERFRLRSTLHAPALLVFASRYYVGTLDVWNRHFKLAKAGLVEQLAALRRDDEREQRALEE